jgi:hypothetical protein
MARGQCPANTAAGAARWCDLLGLRAMPPWRPAWQGYALGLELSSWLGGEVRRATPVAARMLARAWVQGHGRALAALGLSVPDARDRLAAEYDDVLPQVVEQLTAWFGERS